MAKTLNATYEDGVFKPDEPVDLPEGSRVQLQIREPHPDHDRIQAFWNSPERKAGIGELRRMLENTPVKPGGTILTREQLHECHPEQ